MYRDEDGFFHGYERDDFDELLGCYKFEFGRCY